MPQKAQYGHLCIGPNELVLVPRCSYGIGTTDQCTIRIAYPNYDGVNVVVHVHEEGFATLEPIHRQPVVYVNGAVIKTDRLLLPNDRLTVLGKHFVYKNETVDADGLKKMASTVASNPKAFQAKTPRPARMSLMTSTPSRTPLYVYLKFALLLLCARL